MTSDHAIVGEGAAIKVGLHRRWKFAAALLALLGIGAWSTGSLTAQSISKTLKDPLSIFAARSPGERAPGALTSKKGKGGDLGTQVARAVPRERVLSTGRTRPPVPTESADPGTPGMVIDPVEPATDGFVIGEPPFGGSGVVTGGGGGGGVPFFLPPTSNGPGVGVITEPGTGGGTPVPPVSAVPEPQTWLTMMIGLFAIGATLRRRRAATAVVAAAPGPNAAGPARC